MLARQKELIKRQDDTRESIPVLIKNIEEKRGERQRALDGFVLNEVDEKTFKKADEALLKAENDYKTAMEVSEALQRQIKIIETNLLRKHGAVDQLRREIWQAIVEEIKGAIDADTFEIVERYMVAVLQLGGSYEAQLQKLFPKLSSERFQEIYKGIVSQYEID